jgi:hypothetical protein
VRRYPLSASPAQLAQEDWRDVLVVFCRYVNAAWLKMLRLNRHRVAGVGLFVDDDIEAMVAAPELPLRYRLRLRRLASGRWRHLLPMVDVVWVSTPQLAETWRARPTRWLPPIADVVDLTATPAANGATLVGLHATGSHRADQIWLAPVIQAVLAASRDVTFEVVADGLWALRWRGDPRVRVIPSREWPSYRADTANVARALLLAPLKPTQVNAARAEVKRIDAARCGAALLVSDPVVYQVSQAEAALGMVNPLDPGAWTRAVLLLASDPERRESLVRLNRERLLAMRRATPPLFDLIPDSHPDVWRLA